MSTVIDMPRAPVVRDPKADAFRPLPGQAPAALEHAKGCRWPVHLAGNPMREVARLCCDAPRDGGSYCATHTRMAAGTGTPAERRGVPAEYDLRRFKR
ncbi:hypothetical protein [Aureimonas mangrovi]|uniref:hypothetical protein n=1 Tax=Aureimonas mangrovi TaxID=2758041 RepID=UPI00163DB621|nr:hypothetical protein [Aureimonas mangrovi]